MAYKSTFACRAAQSCVFHYFTALRGMQSCRRGLAMRFLSICLSVLYREILEVHPQHTECTPQDIFGVWGKFGAYISSFRPSFEGDD